MTNAPLSTKDDPIKGTLHRGKHPIADYDYWIEDGMYCLWSHEFNIGAISSESEGAAFEQLGENLEGLLSHWLEIVEAGKGLAENELVLAKRLMARFGPALFEEMQKLEQRDYLAPWQMGETSKPGSFSEVLSV